MERLGGLKIINLNVFMKPYVKTLSVAMLGLAASAGIAATAFAHSGRPGQDEGPLRDLDISQDQKKEIHEAIQNDDYEGWKSLMEQYGADVEIMSQEEFEQMREMRESIFRAGHHHEDGDEHPEGKHMKKGSPESREAVENGDYSAFKQSAADTPLQNITEEDFNKLVESHNLKKEVMDKYKPEQE